MTRSAMPQRDAYLERVTESGLICHSCGAEFMRASGHPVSCAFCYPKLSLSDQRKYPLCVYQERNKEAHKTEARKRRTVREAREQLRRDRGNE